MATTFDEFYDEWELFGFVEAAENREIFERLKRLRRAARDGEVDQLVAAFTDPFQADVIRAYAAKWLHVEAQEETVVALGRVLLSDNSDYLRGAAADALGRLKFLSAVTLLAEASLTARNPWLRLKIAHAMNTSRSKLKWEEKVDSVLGALVASRLYREQIDASALIHAVMPDAKTVLADRFALPNYLIRKAQGKDERMIGILATLILASVRPQRLFKDTGGPTSSALWKCQRTS